MKIPHYEKFVGEPPCCHYVWKKLNPTGRWKITTNSDGDCALWIEHIIFFCFTKWIHESKIELKYEQTEEIFECAK